MKSSHKSDNKIAMLAGALKRKTPARAAAEAPQSKASRAAKTPKQSSPDVGDASYEEAVIRVSTPLLAHANRLALDLQDSVQKAQQDTTIKVAPNRVLMVALLRWKQVTMEDRDEIVRRGREDKDVKEHAMWLGVTKPLQLHIAALQRQFVERGVPIAKTGCNEPAIARQALWRWKEITKEDVAFYIELPAA